MTIVRMLACCACLCVAQASPAMATGVLDGLGDPTQPAAALPAAKAEQANVPDASGWRLQAVSIRGNQRSVVINGKVFRLGQRRDGAVVTRISHSAAVLNVDGATYTLRLVQENVKSGSTVTR